MESGISFDEARKELNERRMREWGVDPVTGLARENGVKRSESGTNWGWGLFGGSGGGVRL
jgi:hypothetical protein